jgi:hypothetical protein
MRHVARERAPQVVNPSGGCGESAEKAKKMLFRGNEPKNLLKIKELAFSRAQNELSLDRRNRPSERKI